MSTNICPCCGYDGLDTRPYQCMDDHRKANGVAPPYAVHFGDPSYDVCDCCGFEYGFDDDPGIGRRMSFEEYREAWIAEGVRWFDESKRPDGWSLDAQLKRAGIRGVE